MNIKLESGRASGEPVDSKAMILWWNHNIVAPYTGRSITFTSDRLHAISGIARLFTPRIRSPYVAGLWLAELDDGLEWGRAGDTFQDAKLPDYPTSSWAAHPGLVAWPYQIDTRADGRVFDLVDYRPGTLAGHDSYGTATEAHLTL